MSTEETVNVKELNKEDFLHAMAWSYDSLIKQVEEAMKDKKLPHGLFNKLSLLCHKTIINDFKKRYEEIKDVQFHF